MVRVFCDIPACTYQVKTAHTNQTKTKQTSKQKPAPYPLNTTQPPLWFKETKTITATTNITSISPGRNGNGECNNTIGNVKGRNNALKIIKLVILEEGDWDVRGLGDFSLGPPPNLFFMSHPFYVIVSANNPLFSS